MAVLILSLKCYFQIGNSIEDYRAAIRLFNIKKMCLYGLVNFRAESYQQIMLLTNLQCPAVS
jgi:hypothetical protein